MKTFKLTLVLLLIATVTFAQKSPRKQANGKIGEVTIDVDYGAPSVRERVIWGELVPYNKVWRAGANENTTISFDKDVKIGKNSVPAGKYGLFIIPNKDGAWSIILSKKNDAWGSNGYNENNDLFRMSIKPNIEDNSIEQLSFKVYKKGVQFSWEKARIWIPVK
jgi:hypothetical protein